MASQGLAVGLLALAPEGNAMAEMFLQISVSLDGYIEDRNGDIEWMTSDTSLDALMTDTL